MDLLRLIMHSYLRILITLIVGTTLPPNRIPLSIRSRFELMRITNDWNNKMNLIQSHRNKWKKQALKKSSNKKWIWFSSIATSGRNKFWKESKHMELKICPSRIYPSRICPSRICVSYAGSNHNNRVRDTHHRIEDEKCSLSLKWSTDWDGSELISTRICQRWNQFGKDHKLWWKEWWRKMKDEWWWKKKDEWWWKKKGDERRRMKKEEKKARKRNGSKNNRNTELIFKFIFKLIRNSDN